MSQSSPVPARQRCHHTAADTITVELLEAAESPAVRQVAGQADWSFTPRRFPSGADTAVAASSLPSLVNLAQLRREGRILAVES